MVKHYRYLTTIAFFLCVMTIVSGWFKFGSFNNEKLSALNVTFDDQTYPLVILGGGMAGLTAADYCAQANVPCIIIEGPMPGGALGQAHSIRNWPGVIDAPGADIANSLRKQAVANGVKIVSEKVVGVDFSQWPRIITTQDLENPSSTKKIKALTVFIAMGTDQKFLGIQGESGSDGYWGKGVGKCCVCERPLCKNKHVAIVGGGDGAIREADGLIGIARKITIFVRAKAFDTDIKDAQAKERVLKNPTVEVMYNTEVKKMLGDGSKLTGVMLLNNSTNEYKDFTIDRLFLAIGSRPNTGLFKNQLKLSKKGFIELYDCRESSVAGVYAGGDVSDPDFVQAVTASSDGCKSALQALTLLRKIDFSSEMVPPSMVIIKQDDVIEEAKKDAKENSKSEKTNPNITDIKIEADFDTVVATPDKLVLIDIFSPMCTSCQKMMPIVDKAADEYAGKVAFAKFNASNKDLNLENILKKIGSNPPDTLPAFIFIKGGKEVGRFDGVVTLDEFKSKIDAISTGK